MSPFTPRDWQTQPGFIDQAYRSTALRGPKHAPIRIPHRAGETSGPQFGQAWAGPLDADLTRNGRVNGLPLGERILVTGRVTDDQGRPVPDTMIELWQANAAGRYGHRSDRHDAPLDPNFRGAGRTVSDADGYYRFLTIRPGAYPWGNHPNAWRPNHLHFSLFGQGFASRLVTQMYFPGDPLLELDPIFNATPAPARKLLVAGFDLAASLPDWALCYRFDIVLRGPAATPMEP